MEKIDKEKINDRHNHKIWVGDDNYWKTYVYDESKPNKRRIVRKRTEEDLYEYLDEYYRSVTLDDIKNDFSQYKEVTFGNVKEAAYLISCKGDIYSVFEKKWLPHHVEYKNNYKIDYVTLELKNGKQYDFMVYVLVMMTWNGDAPADMENPTIDHIDGDTMNNHYRNLRWLPRWQNSAIRKMRGLGESNNRNVLSFKDVVHICNLLVKKLYTADELAEMYHVHPSTIRKIREKKSWPYLTELFEFYD